MNRLKQAKDEAEEEVAKYRAQMEKEFQKTISEVQEKQPLINFNSFYHHSVNPNFIFLTFITKQSTGFSGVNVKRLDEEMVTKIDHLKKQAAKVSPEVIKMLMSHVTTVKF